MSEERKSTLELVSQVQEFMDMHEFMEDEDVDTALAYIIKLIAKPDVPATKVPELIVKLQAISAKCGMLARYHQDIGKNSKKKNVYYSMRDNIDKLVAALKYYVKPQF